MLADLVEGAGKQGLLDGKFSGLHTQLAVEFSKTDEFVKARWNEIASKCSEEQREACNACGQRAGRFENDGLVCAFCGTKSSASEAADAYLENFRELSAYDIAKEGGEWPRYECPECESDALVFVGGSEGGTRCFSCQRNFSRGSLKSCEKCERLFPGTDEDVDVCPDCWQDMIDFD